MKKNETRNMAAVAAATVALCIAGCATTGMASLSFHIAATAVVVATAVRLTINQHPTPNT